MGSFKVFQHVRLSRVGPVVVTGHLKRRWVRGGACGIPKRPLQGLFAPLRVNSQSGFVPVPEPVVLRRSPGPSRCSLQVRGMPGRPLTPIERGGGGTLHCSPAFVQVKGGVAATDWH